MNKSNLFKSAHKLTMDSNKKFEGTENQVTWAKDAYNRYAQDAKQGVNDLQVLANTDLRQNLQEAIIMTSVGSIRPLTNQQELDALCIEIKDAIESMTAINWIHFDQAFRGAKKSQQMLSLYTQAINIIKSK